MRKQTLYILLSFFTFYAKAQITISVQLPSGGMVQKEQLWNVTVVNNGNEMASVGLVLNLQDAVTGQTVLSAISGTVLLPKGVRLFTLRDIEPVQYNYYSVPVSGNYLPLGAYIACYRVVKYVSDGQTTVAEECVRIQINPLSPPLLTSPAHQSQIETGYPQFSWMPPAPIDMFTELNYEILLTEVLEGQSATEAILNNNPVYINSNLSRVFEMYPSSYATLDTGKLYAWQVTARNGQNYAGQTEVWTFRLKAPELVQEKTKAISYIVLSPKEEGGSLAYLKGEDLYIKHYSFSREHKATLKLLSADGKLIQESAQNILYGNNFLKIQLNKSFLSDTMYRIELSDGQGRIYSAVFILK